MISDAGALAFGDIVLVPFPFTDQSGAKRRPAVVIATVSIDDAWLDVILMPITSQLRDHAHARDCVVADWSAAGLVKPSAIKPAIATLEQRLISRRLGSLQPVDLSALHDLLTNLIGC